MQDRRQATPDAQWSRLNSSIVTGFGILAAVAIYSIALYYTYKLKIAPLYAYTGLTFREPSAYHTAAAVLMVAAVAWMMPRRLKRVSDFILWILFVRTVAPSILLAQFSRTLTPDEALLMGAAVAGSMTMVIVLTAAAPRDALSMKRLHVGIDFWVILGAFAGLIYCYLIVTTGISFRVLSFSDVYDTRADFAEAGGGGAIIGYSLRLLTNVINPLFVARGIYSGRALPLIAGIGGQFLVYATAGHKSHLFSVAVMIGVALLFRWNRRPPGVAILWAVTVASSLAVAADRLLGGITWTSLISRRAIIVPAALTAAYVAVFQERPRQWFADVLPFIDNPYTSIRPPNLVGAEFVGNPDTFANVNLFGHGYLQAGYLGMFIEAAVLVVLVALANAATRGLPLPVACLVFVAPAMALTSASVFSTVLTHGFLAAIVLSAIAPSRGWGKRAKSRATEVSRVR